MDGTEAERLAARAAEDAGWRIRWPRLRMMSHSPDLASDPAPAAPQQQPQQPQPQQQQPTTWAQVRRFVSEITEVFGSTAAVSAGEPLLSLDTIADHVDSPGGRETNDGRRVRSFIGAAALAAEKEEVAVATQGQPMRSRVAAWARVHPLAVLVAAWTVLMATDWIVASAVAPQTLAVLTARPWVPLAARGGWCFGIPGMAWRAVRGDAWVDGAVWRAQLLAVDAAAALARPYALHWLCLAAVSARIVRRCSRMGARALVLCALYFAASDAALWAAFGPPAASHALDSSAPALPLSILSPHPHPLSPPAAAAAEKEADAARWRALRERPWVSSYGPSGRHRQLPDGGAGSRALPALATLAVHASALARARRLGRAAAWQCAALLGLGIIVRGSAGCAAQWAAGAGRAACVAGAGARAGLLPIHALSTFGLLALREVAFVVHSMRAWYATTICDRRRGPAMVGARLPPGSAITVTSALAPVSAPRDRPGPADAGEAPQRALTLSQVAGLVRAPYAHRVCCLCLSGFCERCLLSMNIWPTAHADPVPANGAPATAAGRPDTPGDTSPVAAHPPPAAAPAAAHPRRRGGRARHGKTASVTRHPAPGDTGGLLPHGESLLTLGLLGPEAGPAAGPAARRGKTVEAWVASSVAHCPCRAVHGVGPSSFVSRAAKVEYMQQARADGEPSAFAAPRGTLVPLAQYVAELRSLGLVRPVDPASVVFSDEDPASSVLPLIFGRFTVPANPHAVSAANALLASSATSYAQLLAHAPRHGHVPGSAPFLGHPAAAADPRSGTVARSRILARPTPLSLARAPAAASFRLCVEHICAGEGAVLLHIIVTPALAQLLLTHPHTSPSAAVCVPASLAGVMASRASPGGPGQPAQPAQQGIAAATSRVADADPFLDHVRVQLPRADVVVRVNGQRWADADVGWALNETVRVRGLAVDCEHRVSLAVCGMRSEELAVVLPSAQAAVSQARLAKKRAREDALAELDDIHRQHAAAQQLLKRARRDAPKQIHHCHAELDALRRAAARAVQTEARFRHRHAQLQDSLAEARADLALLRTQREEAQEHRRGGDDDSSRADSASSADESASPSPAGQPMLSPSAFDVLSRLGDANGADSTAGSAAKTAPDQAAAAVLRRAEQQARETRATLEDSLQELKRERARWLDRLAADTQQLQPLQRALEPARRDLADATKRLAAGKIAAAKLRRQMSDLDRQLVGLEAADSADAAATAEAAQAQLIRRVAALREALRTESAG